MSISPILLLKHKVKAWIEKLGFDYSLAEDLSSGHVVVPQAVLRASLEQTLTSYPNIELARLECFPDGIHFRLRANRLLATIDFPLTLHVLSVAINSQEQTLSLSYHTDRPVGVDILGKIISAFAQSILISILHERISDHPFMLESSIDETGNKIRVNLGVAPAIARLGSYRIPAIPFLPLPGPIFPLDHLTLELAHVENGLKVIGSLGAHGGSR